MKFILIAATLLSFSTECISATEIGCSQIKSDSLTYSELSKLIEREGHNLVQKPISLDALDDRFCHSTDKDFVVAQLYYYGNFLVKDIHKAISNLEIAIANGNKKAIFFLATIYLSEKEFMDIEKAVFLLEKAAEHGISEAKYNLFLMYQKGKYDDFQRSLVWLQDVVKEGDESAIILFAQAMHDITDATKLDKYVKKGLQYLENKDFKKKKVPLSL